MDDEHKGPAQWAIDFDGSLATYDGFKGADVLGDPIPEAVERVKDALAAGEKVWIYTARISPSDDSFEEGIKAVKAFAAIAQWVQNVFGQILPITNIKNRRWLWMEDDRSRELIPNTGIRAMDLVDSLAGNVDRGR